MPPIEALDARGSSGTSWPYGASPASSSANVVPAPTVTWQEYNPALLACVDVVHQGAMDAPMWSADDPVQARCGGWPAAAKLYSKNYCKTIRQMQAEQDGAIPGFVEPWIDYTGKDGIPNMAFATGFRVAGVNALTGNLTNYNATTGAVTMSTAGVNSSTARVTLSATGATEPDSARTTSTTGSATSRTAVSTTGATSDSVTSVGSRAPSTTGSPR